MFAYYQNAWQTESPDEMVEFIDLDIPTGADVENPAEDTALMERISATKNPNTDGSGDQYELKNVATLTRFTFEWSQINGRHSRWILDKV